MDLFISVKQIGKKRALIGERRISIDRPETLRALITSVVRSEAEKYNSRRETAVSAGSVSPALSQDVMDDMAAIGKVAFGVNYNGNRQDIDSAVDNALVSFSDGIYRAFADDEELVDLDAPVHIKEGCRLTFVRLVMLAGRLW